MLGTYLIKIFSIIFTEQMGQESVYAKFIISR